MPKSRPSKLDAYAEQLDGWLCSQAEGGEGITLRAAVERLAELKCAVSISGVSKWWTNRQAQLNEAAFLERLRTGAETTRRVRAALVKDPPPALQELIAIHRKLVFDLATDRTADPKLLELANSLTKSVLEFAKLEERSRQTTLGERRVQLLEKKAEQADATEGVIDDVNLSPDEREQRIKEIYGRA